MVLPNQFHIISTSTFYTSFNLTQFFPQYFQIDVLVQSPNENDAAPPSTIWRRFSEFRQLHANVSNPLFYNLITSRLIVKIAIS